MNRKRGTGVIEVIAVVAIIGVSGWIGSKFFGKTAGSEKDTPIEEVNNLKDEVKAKTDVYVADIDFRNAEQLNTAQAAIHANTEALNKAVTKSASGGDATREITTAQDINDIAKTAIDLGLDKPVDPKLLKWFLDAVEKKNSEIAHEREIGQKMLGMKEGELIKSQERENKTRKEFDDFKIQSAKDLAKIEKERDRWALENDVKASKLDKIMLFVYGIAGVYIFALIAPILAKIFPAMKPIATVAGAVVAPAIQWAKSKSDKLATDLVALQNDTKKFVETIDDTKVAEYKEHVKSWWENDTSSQSDVENIKKDLRL